MIGQEKYRFGQDVSKFAMYAQPNNCHTIFHHAQVRSWFLDPESGLSCTALGHFITSFAKRVVSLVVGADDPHSSRRFFIAQKADISEESIHKD